MQRVLAAITAAPLSPEDEELFSDEFFDFRERKNGRAWVLKDAEDGAVLACIGAFEKCREPDETPFEVAVDVEELLTGKVGPMTLAEDPPVWHLCLLCVLVKKLSDPSPTSPETQLIFDRPCPRSSLAYRRNDKGRRKESLRDVRLVGRVRGA